MELEAKINAIQAAITNESDAEIGAAVRKALEATEQENVNTVTRIILDLRAQLQQAAEREAVLGIHVAKELLRQ